MSLSLNMTRISRRFGESVTEEGPQGYFGVCLNRPVRKRPKPWELEEKGRRRETHRVTLSEEKRQWREKTGRG